ncbi:MAG: hypothetical protein RSF40_11400, partial [Oscillospiraceae bacterium]
YAQAFAIIDNNPQLDSKAFVAVVMNLINQALLAIEQLYFTNVDDFLVLKLTNYNTSINNFVSRKIWNNMTAYKIGNFVYYNDDMYFCLKDNINTAVTDTNYWLYLGLRGEAGSPSIGTTLKYDWSPSVRYNPKDVVALNGNLYVSKTANINKVPMTSPSDWEAFLLIPKAKIIVSKTPPPNPYTGMIWWEILN